MLMEAAEVLGVLRCWMDQQTTQSSASGWGVDTMVPGRPGLIRPRPVVALDDAENVAEAILQRRLASSPAAIHESLRRRKARLERSLEETTTSINGTPGSRELTSRNTLSWPYRSSRQ